MRMLTVPEPNNGGLGPWVRMTRDETHDEDWSSGIGPWEVDSKDIRVPKLIDGKVPYHPHRRHSMERIQEHHPYEIEKRSGI